MASFPIFGTGGLWKAASGSGTAVDPFVPAVNITGGGTGFPLTGNVDAAGFAITNQALDVSSASVTAAGSNQGNAAALSAGENFVQSADGTKGVILPAAIGTGAGPLVIVLNSSSFTLPVYPPSGKTLDGGATNAPVYAPPGWTWFYARPAGAWRSSLPLAGVSGTFTHANSPVGTPLTAVPNNINPVDTSGGTVAVKLPTPGLTSYVIFQDAAANFDTNNLTVVQAGSEKINGVAASFIVKGRGAFFSLVSDGTNWNLPTQPNPPLVTNKSGAYTFVLADAGQSFTNSGASNTLTIDSNANVAYPFGPGSAITITNKAATALTIAVTGSATINGTNANRTLAAATTGTYATVSIWPIAADTWIMAGTYT